MNKTGIPEIDLHPHKLIIGMDEAGTGAWAGPFCIGAVMVSREWPWHPEVADSKALTEKRREQLVDSIHMKSWVLFVWPDEIDRKGLGVALRAGYSHLIDLILQDPECHDPLVVVDGSNQVDPRALVIPKADAKVKAVSMASMYAKVTRDRHMRQENRFFPQYGFNSHVGYGTQEHQKALEQYGPCDLHRMSYRPLHKYKRS